MTRAHEHGSGRASGWPWGVRALLGVPLAAVLWGLAHLASRLWTLTVTVSPMTTAYGGVLTATLVAVGVGAVAVLAGRLLPPSAVLVAAAIVGLPPLAFAAGLLETMRSVPGTLMTTTTWPGTYVLTGVLAAAGVERLVRPPASLRASKNADRAVDEAGAGPDSGPGH